MDNKDSKNNDVKKEEITDSQLFWYKNKNKVIAGVATVGLLAVFGLGMWFMFNHKDSSNDDKTKFVSDEQRIADFLIVPTKDTVILNQTNKAQDDSNYTFKKVDSTKTTETTIYANSNSLDELYGLDTNTKKVTKYQVNNSKLASEEVFEYKGDLALESFKYNNKVLVGYNKGYLTIQYNDDVNVVKVDGNVVNYLVTGKRVLYAIGTELYSYNVEDKSTKKVSLEKDIQDIELINNQVVAIGKFGETKGTSSIASFKVADLYATGLTTVPYANGTALQNSSKNVDFYVFSKDDKDKNKITNVTISNEILKVEKLKGTFDDVSDKDVGRNGYAYLISKDKVSVIDVNTGNEVGSLKVENALAVAPAFY